MDNEQQLLQVLGRIYAETSVGYHKVSLTKIVDEYAPRLRSKQAWIRALIEMRVVLKENELQRHPALHWNLKEWGVPSLAMVDSINLAVEDVKSQWRENRVKKTIARTTESYHFTVRRSARKWNCKRCPFSGSSACSFFKEQGFSCSSYDMRTLRFINPEDDEVSVGQ